MSVDTVGLLFSYWMLTQCERDVFSSGNPAQRVERSLFFCRLTSTLSHSLRFL